MVRLARPVNRADAIRRAALLKEDGPSVVAVGILTERVSGLENSQKALGDGLNSLRLETAQQISNLSDSLSHQISDVAKTLTDNQQSFLRSKSTNWAAFGGTAAGIVGVLLSIGAAVLAPINSNVGQNSLDIRELVRLSQTKVDAEQAEARGVATAKALLKEIERLQDSTVPRTEITELEKRLDERALLDRTQAQRDRDVLWGSVRDVEAQLVKRPEISALLDDVKNRLDALSRNLEDTRREVGSSYTIGDQVKALDRQLEQIRNALLPAGGQPPAAIVNTGPATNHQN